MRLLAARITLRRRPTRHAITDLYDEERRTFLIKYPVWLIVALGIAGVVVFAVTGFLGYPGTPSASPLGDPILLLPWLYVLQVTLEISIFRDHSLRWHRLLIVGATLLSIVLLVVAALNSNEVQTAIQQYLQHPQQPISQPQGNGVLLRLAGNAWTYIIINFVILGIFWLDTAQRWIRRALGLSPNPSVDLGLDVPAHSALPHFEDMISGDLLAAGLLSLALGLLVQPQLISRFVTVAGQPGLDWLSGLDIMQTLITLPLGLIILGLAATLNGLNVIGGVQTGRARVPSAPLPAGSARKAVSQEVSLTVINTLQAALDRRVRAAIRALVMSLRNVLWPLLILISTAALAIAAELLEAYLHDPNKTSLPAIITVALAAVLGVVAALFTVFAAALILFNRRVASNSLRFLGLVGFVVLLTFWMFSLALSGFNLLLLQVNPQAPTPFIPLGLSTYISLAALVIYGALALRRLARGPQEVAPDGAAVTTETGPADAGDMGPDAID